MNRQRIWASAAAVVATLTLGVATLANADDPAPTREQAQAALAHIDTDQAVIKAYLDSLATPSPPPTTAPPTTVPPTTVPPTTVPPTTVPPTTTPPPASTNRSGMPWLSGTNPQWQGAVNVTAFESMRGKPVDIIVIHPARDNWTALNDNWAYTEPIPDGYLGTAGKGRLSFAMPLWPGNGAVGTNYNSQWTAWANRVEAMDPRTDVRLGWEMNLPSSAWHVNPGNRTAWIAAFNRAAIAIHTACPGCTVTFNPNWGGDQTDVDVRGVFQAVKANVDTYGIDYYDAWEPITASNDAARRDAYRSLTDSYNYAVANGKKFALPEWGVACNFGGCQWEGHAGGDNDRYVNHVFNFLKSKPANTIAYDAWFDEEAGYIQSQLTTREGRPTVNPKSAAAYRAQILALAH